MALFKATYSGVIGASEAFAFGWAFVDDVVVDPAAQISPLTTWLTTFLDTVTSSTSAKAMFHTSIQWTNIRCSRYFAGNVEATSNGPVSRAGTSNTVPLPYEVACCVSLTSTVTTGPKRGRFYLPPFSTNFMGTGGVYTETGGLDVLRGGIFAAFDGFQTADRRVGIMRNVQTPSPLTIVNGAETVSVGNVPDAQRRRRNKLVEVRVAHTIV